MRTVLSRPARTPLQSLRLRRAFQDIREQAARPDHAPKTILLATDFQAPARKAFAHAVSLAALFHAKLVILHVMKAVPTGRHGSGLGSRYLGPIKTAAMLELGRLARAARHAGVKAETRLLCGAPWACILETAEKLRPELMALGTHGKVGWDRLQLGSTAETVVREAPCPVLTLHGMVPGDAFRHPARARWRRLLVGTDLSSSTQTILRYAAGLAKRLDASLLILHALGNGSRSRSLRQAFGPNQKSARSKKSRQRQLDRWASMLQAQDLQAEGRCVAGAPVETIVGEAARWNADMLILGTVGRRGFSRLLLGSVAEGVIRRAGCAVLTIPAAATHGLRKGRGRS
ncbi:MAG TPA: universal stress protein [Nitrospiraceae bacterium]|nr:universal stress protein [Nitrospiraceae bacterium]